MLQDVGYIDDNMFNRYGQAIAVNHDYERFAVIDYKGNRILTISPEQNSISQHYDGLYEVHPHNHHQLNDESFLESNFYNQKGEKLLGPEDIHLYRNLEYREGKETNYIWHNDYDRPYIILDKENKILKKGFNQ